jgi:hypothetical protein
VREQPLDCRASRRLALSLAPTHDCQSR